MQRAKIPLREERQWNWQSRPNCSPGFCKRFYRAWLLPILGLENRALFGRAAGSVALQALRTRWKDAWQTILPPPQANENERNDARNVCFWGQPNGPYG